MTKVFDCPRCLKRSCVSDTTGLNVCVYCGLPVNGDWRYAYGSHERKSFKEKELSPALKKIQKMEQISLFNVNDYQKPQAWNGG